MAHALGNVERKSSVSAVPWRGSRTNLPECGQQRAGTLQALLPAAEAALECR